MGGLKGLNVAYSRSHDYELLKYNALALSYQRRDSCCSPISAVTLLTYLLLEKLRRDFCKSKITKITLYNRRMSRIISIDNVYRMLDYRMLEKAAKICIKF